MKERYTITKYEYEVDYDVSDSVLIDEDSDKGDLTEAVDAWNSDCWDHEDWQEDCVNLYPADWQTNYRTGEVTYTNVIISGKPRHIHWLKRSIHGWNSLSESTSSSSESTLRTVVTRCLARLRTLRF